MNKRFFLGMALIGVLLVAGILSGGNLRIFLDFPSAVIVVGITVGATVGSFSWADITQAFGGALSGADLDEDVAARSQAVLNRAADAAVASGLVGALVGLVLILSNLSDPTAIGPAMAVALLTVFYGTLLGELFLRSLASDVGARSGGLPARGDRRGTTTVYVSMATLFMLLLVFMLMLVSMANFV